MDGDNGNKVSCTIATEKCKFLCRNQVVTGLEWKFQINQQINHWLILSHINLLINFQLITID